jgi:hypothetical protein
VSTVVGFLMKSPSLEYTLGLSFGGSIFNSISDLSPAVESFFFPLPLSFSGRMVFPVFALEVLEIRAF